MKKGREKKMETPCEKKKNKHLPYICLTREEYV